MKQYIFFLFLLLAATVNAQDLTNAKNEKPIKLSGSLALGGYFYNSTNPLNQLPPLGYSAAANLNIKFYGFDIPLYALVNDQGSQLSNPFNRFGISPKYKWLHLHLGYHNYNWSPFVLSGTNVYGVGVEVNPKKGIRLGAFRGRFQEAISFNNDEKFTFPRYQRAGYGFKLGIGGRKTYMDIYFLKGKDDEASLSSDPDSLRSALLPKENVNIGLSGRYSFLKNRLFFKFDGAVSAFTDDLRQEAIDISSFPQGERLANIFTPNASTSATYAGEASFNLRLNTFGLSAVYRKVMPEFQTFGVNYLLSDIETFTINPSFTLLDSKMQVSGSFGKQFNNLDNNLSAKTERDIGSINLNVNPSPKFGFSAQYANFSLYQQVIIDTLNQDSILLDQINHNINFTPRLTFISSKMIQNIVLNINYQVLADNTPNPAFEVGNDFLLANLNYFVTLLASKITLNIGLNYFDYNSEFYANQQYGATVGVSKRFLKDKMNISFNSGINRSKQATSSGLVWNTSTNINYRLSKKTAINLQLFRMYNAVRADAFNEFRSQMRFVRTF